MADLEIARVGYFDAATRVVTDLAQADLAQRYGSGDETPIGLTDFDPPGGCFLLAYVDGEPVGCGGWRTLAEEPGTAEVKRMFTVPHHRGAGVASALLAALEDSARAAGKGRIVLETGLRQPEAIALYRKLGYQQIPNFGYYKDHSLSMSFGRGLTPDQPSVSRTDVSQDR